jgi:hypothetical protein
MVMDKTNHHKSNFIRQHIICKIFEKSYNAREILNIPHNSFIYFDKDIRIKNGKFNLSVNRFGKGGLHGRNEILPIPWSILTGQELLESLFKIKDREFYVNREIDGRSFKTRIKKIGK